MVTSDGYKDGGINQLSDYRYKIKLTSTDIKTLTGGMALRGTAGGEGFACLHKPGLLCGPLLNGTPR